jgi:glycosyltransferase involved in cell wall biosynthesis
LKVSIITANFNCGPYIKTCIESVQKQNFDDYEHIILDDLSTDKSSRIMRKLAEKDPHITIFKPKKRLHCGSAYFRLSHMAQGDIIGVLDADDALCGKAMIRLIKLYDKYPDVSYIWSQFWFCDPRLGKIREGVSMHPGNRSLLESGLLGKHCFSHWRTFRRSILRNGEVFTKGIKTAVDKWMGYSLEELGVGGFTKEVLYKYRQRLGGLSFTGKRSWRKAKEHFTNKRIEQNIIPFPIKKLEL